MTIITISGPPGSGTSSVAKKLIAQLNKVGHEFEYRNIGQYWRRKHQAENPTIPFEKYWRSISIEDNLRADTNILSEMKNSGRNYIYEARFGALACRHNNVHAYKIYVEAPVDVRVQRMLEREPLEIDNAEHDTAEKIATRLRDEIVMGYDMYGKDFTWPYQYDSIVDASMNDVDTIVDYIMRDLEIEGIIK